MISMTITRNIAHSLLPMEVNSGLLYETQSTQRAIFPGPYPLNG